MHLSTTVHRTVFHLKPKWGLWPPFQGTGGQHDHIDTMHTLDHAPEREYTAPDTPLGKPGGNHSDALPRSRSARSIDAWHNDAPPPEAISLHNLSSCSSTSAPLPNFDRNLVDLCARPGDAVDLRDD